MGLIYLLLVAVCAGSPLLIDYGETHVSILIDGEKVRVEKNVSFTPENRRFVAASAPGWFTASLAGLVCRKAREIDDLAARGLVQIDDEVYFNASGYSLAGFANGNLGERAHASLFRPDELQAMVFEYALILHASRTQANESAAIMTVPPWFSPVQRKQLYGLARLGGIDVVSMVTETASVALSIDPKPRGHFVVCSIGYSAKTGVYLYVDGVLYTVQENWLFAAGSQLTACEEKVFGESGSSVRRNNSDDVCRECAGIIQETVDLIQKSVEAAGIEHDQYELYLAGGNSDLQCLIDRIQQNYTASVKVLNETAVFRGLPLADKAMHGPFYSTSATIKVGDAHHATFELFDSFGRSDKMRVEELAVEDDLKVELVCLDPASGGQIHASTYEVFGVFEAVTELKEKGATGLRVRLVYYMDQIGLPLVGSADVLFEDETQKTSSIKLNVVHTSESELSLIEKQKEFNQTHSLLSSILTHEFREGKIDRHLEILDIGIKRALTIRESELARFGQPAELDALQNYARELEAWFTANPGIRADLTDKVQRLNDLYKPISIRYEEHARRAGITDITLEKLDQAELRFKNLLKHKPWVPEEIQNRVKNALKEARDWFEEQVVKQKTRPLDQDPLFTPRQLATMLDTVLSKVEYFSRIEKKGQEKGFKIRDLVMVVPRNPVHRPLAR